MIILRKSSIYSVMLYAIICFPSSSLLASDNADEENNKTIRISSEKKMAEENALLEANTEHSNTNEVELFDERQIAEMKQIEDRETRVKAVTDRLSGGQDKVKMIESARIAIEYKYAEDNAALEKQEAVNKSIAKALEEKTECIRIATEQIIIKEKNARKETVQEASVKAADEDIKRNKSEETQIIQEKVQYAKSELKGISETEAEFKKSQEAKLAAEKAAKDIEKFSGVTAQDEQTIKKELERLAADKAANQIAEAKHIASLQKRAEEAETRMKPLADKATPESLAEMTVKTLWVKGNKPSEEKMRVKAFVKNKTVTTSPESIKVPTSMEKNVPLIGTDLVARTPTIVDPKIRTIV